MPEGHTIHRAALDHGKLLKGRAVAASSPQGRFAEGAALIDGAACLGTEAVGKHLLYHFDTGQSVHIHLGLGGYFTVAKKAPKPPREVTRLRLATANSAVDIIGPNTCELLPSAAMEAFRLRYGPDLLAAKPDPDRAVAAIRKSRAPIARLLMDQKVISGIGNIYRAEILWLRGLNPMTRGVDLPEAEIRGLWDEMRALLQLGVKKNAIITNRDAVRAGRVHGERTNIFGKPRCPRCQGVIEKSKLSGRTLYHCPTCQA
ncbi:MAG: DNA-formamidopyrimidine glycosylase family protein [Pseudomonadota bacterium]